MLANCFAWKEYGRNVDIAWRGCYTAAKEQLSKGALTFVKTNSSLVSLSMISSVSSFPEEELQVTELFDPWLESPLRPPNTFLMPLSLVLTVGLVP